MPKIGRLLACGLNHRAIGQALGGLSKQRIAQIVKDARERGALPPEAPDPLDVLLLRR